MCKEKLLLVGAGGFGRVVSETAVLNYDCAFVDDGVEKGTEICGVEVVGNTSDLLALFKHWIRATLSLQVLMETICCRRLTWLWR